MFNNIFPKIVLLMR